MAFEKFIIPSGESTKRMSLHLFRAILQEYIAEEIDKPVGLDLIEEHLGVTLTTDEKADLNALMTAIDGETLKPDKMQIADEVYRVLVIATSSNVTKYNTGAKIKTRLSWL